MIGEKIKELHGFIKLGNFLNIPHDTHTRDILTALMYGQYLLFKEREKPQTKEKPQEKKGAKKLWK